MVCRQRAGFSMPNGGLSTEPRRRLGEVVLIGRVPNNVVGPPGVQQDKLSVRVDVVPDGAG